MKTSNKSGTPILAIIIAILVLLFGSYMYYRSGNVSFLLAGLGIFSITLGIIILNKKETLFIGNSKLKFLENENARKKAYKVRAILRFFIGILFITSIFVSFNIGNIMRISLILTCLITLFYMFKYKK